MKRLLLSCTAVFLCLLNLQATHNRAGEITYVQTGNRTVTATVITYTKASSRPADRDTLTICWGDGTCERVARVNGPGSPPQGEFLPFDSKLNKYQAAHTYEQMGEYTISMQDPNRNGGILNVNFPNSDQVQFYIESRITLLDLPENTENHSPVALVPPLNTGRVGQPFVHVINAVDPDGDSISYELITPLMDFDTEVPNYIDPTMIFPGPQNQLSLHPKTGKLVWDAPQRAGEYNIAFAIKSYRNGVEIGRVIRDMQILVETEGPLLPSLSLNPAYSETEVVCLSAGDTISIQLLTGNIDASILQLTAYSELLSGDTPPASFSADSTTGEGAFFWIVDESLARSQPYQLTFKAEDDMLFANFVTLQFAVESCDGIVRPSRISGFCYWDLNENGLHEEDEPPLANVQMKLSEAELTTFSDENGRFSFIVPAGQYELSSSTSACWKLTTENDNLQINLGISNEVHHSFGFLPSDVEENDLSISISSGPTRCFTEVPFWLSVKNTGCSSQTGWVAFVYDSNASTFSTRGSVPNFFRTDTLWWALDALAPGNTKVIDFFLVMPGAEAIGETLHTEALLFSENCTTIADHEIRGPWQPANAAFNLCRRYDYDNELRCSYDPNDKRVQPDREGDENYTIFDEELEYTIRFQNTGNDTAFVVVIRDTLDQNLDWTTFKPFAASHPYAVVLNEKTGILTFTFDHILLPDSTTNEPASHGFVTYTVASKAGLAEETPIRNRAGIYFDLNPPIITNTTLNTLVSKLPGVSAALDFRRSDLAVNVYPNPFSEEVQFEVDDPTPGPVWLQIFDFSGRLRFVGRYDSIGKGEVFSVSGKAFGGAGIFFYRIWKERSGATGKIIRLE